MRKLLCLLCLTLVGCAETHYRTTETCPNCQSGNVLSHEKGKRRGEHPPWTCWNCDCTFSHNPEKGS